MACPHCSHDNPDQNTFCNQCGGSLQNVCPHCHAVNAPESPFCGGCGKALLHPESGGSHFTSVLAHLLESPDRFSVLLSQLPEDAQIQILQALTGLEPLSPRLLHLLCAAFEEKSRKYFQQGWPRSLGSSIVSDLLQGMDEEQAEPLLNRFAEVEPELVAELRRRRPSFEILLALSPLEMQVVLRHTGQDTLLLALKTASEELQALIFSSMSRRASQMAREDLEIMPPVAVASVREAQREILKTAHTLRSNGEILFRLPSDGAAVPPAGSGGQSGEAQFLMETEELDELFRELDADEEQEAEINPTEKPD